MRSALPSLLLAALATAGLSHSAAADGEYRPVVRKAPPAKVWRAPPQRVVHRVYRPHARWVGVVAPGVVSYRGIVSYNTPAGFVVNHATDHYIRPYGREVVILTADRIDPPGASYPAAVLTSGALKPALVRLSP